MTEYRGYGTGRTREEAEANARADALQKKQEAEILQSGGTLLQMLLMAALGYVMAATMMYHQFLVRPLATILMAAIALLVFGIFLLFLGLMDHLNWWVVSLFGYIAILGLILWGGVFLMEMRNEIVETLDSIEAWERQMLCRAPGWVRVPLVTLETLTPLIVLVTITALYFTSGHFAVEGTRFLWVYIVVALATVLIQVVAFGKRVEASEMHGDFSVFGFRFPPR